MNAIILACLAKLLCALGVYLQIVHASWGMAYGCNPLLQVLHVHLIVQRGLQYAHLKVMWKNSFGSLLPHSPPVRWLRER